MASCLNEIWTNDEHNLPRQTSTIQTDYLTFPTIEIYFAT